MLGQLYHDGQGLFIYLSLATNQSRHPKGYVAKSRQNVGDQLQALGR
jgi:hypothetical protein